MDEKLDALFLKWLEENGNKFLGDPLAKLRAAFAAGCTAQSEADDKALEKEKGEYHGFYECVFADIFTALSAARIKGEK